MRTATQILQIFGGILGILMVADVARLAYKDRKESRRNGA